MSQVMKYAHPEFAYQSRELGAQIEDTLGEPPDRKAYDRLVKTLIGEYANGADIDDVNLLSFALVDHLQFNDHAGLLSQCTHYDEGDAATIQKMVTCLNEDASKAMCSVFSSNPELARKKSQAPHPKLRGACASACRCCETSACPSRRRPAQPSF